MISSLFFAAAVAAAQPTTPADIAAVERAFAAEGSEIGWLAAFRKYSADDAVVFAPGPVNAKKAWEKLPDDKDTSLKWRPIYTGVAASGDLGFSTGPYNIGTQAHGYYFSVWKKQADGSFKWVFDGGPSQGAATKLAADAPLIAAPMSDAKTLKGATAEKAVAAVKKAEAKLAEVAQKDLTAAFKPWLPKDALVMGSKAEPQIGYDAALTELATRTPTMTYATLHAESSKAGDLVWTYGDVHWVRDGEERDGHYVRIWVKRGAEWKLLTDEILPSPKKKPAAA